ncbi:MAG: putative rane protein [Dehalococcoidia bacterium]|nr:putative rane protein [Dehalococcoidia bacterium]
MFFDPMWLLFMAPAFIFMLYAQAKVKSAYSKYSRVPNARGMSGAQAAQNLLRASGLGHVKVEATRGNLTDHYDPRGKVLRLSDGVYSSTSVAAMGIVAHEVGHAVQDGAGYAPMRVRTALVPAASLGSTLGWIFVMVGLVLSAMGSGFGINVAWLGVILFAAAVLFTLITLPVEFNASSRALQMLRGNGLIVAQEYDGARAVLSAAALTYVAAMLQAVSQLLYFVFLLTGARRRD